MGNIKRAHLTDGPIGLTMVKLTLPMILSLLAMVSFNLIDTFFIGQLGADELAAIGFTFPVVFVIGGIAMGLGVATSSLVSRAIGAGDAGRVKRLATDSLMLAVLTVLFFVILGLLTIEPVFRLLGASSDILVLIKQYMLIWYPGMVFVVVPMVGNNAIRATGDTRTPSFIMMTAVVFNAILDPVLIFGIGPFPRMELAGAAVATVVARAITLVLSIYILYHREKMITLKRVAMERVFDSWRQILYIGMPAAGTNIIIPLGVGIITSLVARYGTEAVAALGVASRIDMLALTVIMALSSVLGPFIGQNLGAGKNGRVHKGVKYSQQFAMVWGLIMLGVLLLASRPIASVFSSDDTIISNIQMYLWIVPLSYGLWGILMLTNSALNVLNKPIDAAILTITRVFVIYVPLAYLGSYLMGLWGIFGAVSVANIFTGVAAYLWLKRTLKVQAAYAAS
ncbi:MAG: MATE family efflux transporter [candidate division KSB1 bacterium]|nr:MATE family efflux transporter [candidate division KSB1 bacterium]